jgi:phage gp45-like
MTARGAQIITWDVENRPLTVTGGATFVYNGDGNRVKKTEGGQTILYINQYYEKNITKMMLDGKLILTVIESPDDFKE